MATVGAQELAEGGPMIDPREINERAGELSLLPAIVEKDYVLGWVLAGIALLVSRTFDRPGGEFFRSIDQG
jgi:hypothetical protein